MLCEPGRAGDAAIDAARELLANAAAALTVIAVSPVAPSGPRCGNSATEYNEAVARSVAADLDRAGERLGPAADRARFVLLEDGGDQTVEQFVRSGDFDLVLLPARRRPLRRAPYHPEAARLRVIAGAEIQIVEPGAAGRRRREPQRAGGAGGS